MPKFACTINDIPANVEIKTSKSKSQAETERLRLESRMFMRRHRVRFPDFIKELLGQRGFECSPKFITENGDAEGDEHKMTLEYGFDELYHTAFQVFLRRLSRWRIVKTEIQATYRHVNLHLSLKIVIKIKSSSCTGPSYWCEVRVIMS